VHYIKYLGSAIGQAISLTVCKLDIGLVHRSFCFKGKTWSQISRNTYALLVSHEIRDEVFPKQKDFVLGRYPIHKLP
jgi:hypothetical protein